MGPLGRVSRRTTTEMTTAAVNKVNELIPIVDAQGMRISELSAQNAALIKVNQDLHQRFDGQGGMVKSLETRQAEDHHHVVTTLANRQVAYVDRRDADILRLQEQFQQMTFVQRFRWLFTGKVA